MAIMVKPIEITNDHSSFGLLKNSGLIKDENLYRRAMIFIYWQKAIVAKLTVVALG